MIKKIPRSIYITIKEFLPKWTAFMELHPTEGKDIGLQHEYGLDIYEGDTCLVGEAHFFEKSYYNCSYCAGVACGHLTIGSYSYEQVLKTLTKFYRFKEGLYNHFMESHREKLMKK